MLRDSLVIELVMLMMSACGAHPATSRSQGAPVGSPSPAGRPPASALPERVSPLLHDEPPSDQCPGSESRLRIVRVQSAVAVGKCEVGLSDRRSEYKTEYETNIHIVSRSSEMVRAASLDGAYLAEWTNELRLRPQFTTPPNKDEDARRIAFLASPDDARRLRSLATAVVGWPGATAVREPDSGVRDYPEFTAPLQTILDVQLHGRPATVVVRSRFGEHAREQWGKALVFAVAIDASASGGASCSRWASDVSMTGSLVLRASDGAIVALRLGGPTVDEETPCTASGKPHNPTICNRGNMSVDLSWTCVTYIPARATGSTHGYE